MDVTATELKHRLGQYMDAAMREPVIVKKSGRKTVVIIAYEDYEHLQALDDAYWGERALKTLKEDDFISGDAALRELERIAKEKGI